jgi:capsular polysaccharide biosynthesis protein
MQNRARRRGALVVALVTGLLVFGVGGLFAVLPPTTYTATSVFALAPRNGSLVSADTVELVAASYSAYLLSPAVTEHVATASDQEPALITAAVRVDIDPGTANVQVAVTLPDAQAATAVANRLAEEGVIRAATDLLVTAELIAPAQPAAAQANPRRSLIVSGTAVAALIITVMSWVGWSRPRAPAAD